MTDRSHKGAKPLILVSNDDGIHAEGIKALSAALDPIGRVVVVAPDGERSAASHSITLHRPLRVARVSEGLYAIDGTPTDCIMLALGEILKERPTLIVSGINHGANLGDDIHYSGTVSAAFEGGIMGIPSIAVSLVGEERASFAAAGRVAARVARKVLEEGLPHGVILNVNIPDCPEEQIQGIVFTKQGKRNYGGVIVEKVDPRGKKYYWIGGDEQGFENIAQSDCNAVLDGYVSITPLRVNLTDGTALNQLSRWEI